MNKEQVLFGMIRGVVCGVPYGEELKSACTEEMLVRVYRLAAKHDLAHLVGQAASRLSLPDWETVKKAKDAAMSAFLRSLHLEQALTESCSVLEQAEIPHIPLKGAILKQLYPESWLRTSCDVDILVKPEHLEVAVAALEEKLGYVAGKPGVHDVTLQCPGGAHLELHFDLVEEGRAAEAAAILRTVWETAKPVESGSYGMEMDEALFYFYHIAHMAKHFETGGCGVRPFIDLWLLDRQSPAQADELLEKGGLLVFAQAARKLSRVWFGGEAPDELTESLETFLLHGGVYGSVDNRVALNQSARGGKLGYLRSRVFAPYEKLKRYYPILEKHRWLTPVMQVRRWGMLLRPDVAARTKKELAANAAGKDSRGSLLQALGLEKSNW